MIFAIRIRDNFGSAYSRQPGETTAVLLRLNAEADIAVGSRTAAGKERLDCEPRW